MENHFIELGEAIFSASSLLDHFAESLHRISRELVFSKKLFGRDSARFSSREYTSGALPNAPFLLFFYFFSCAEPVSTAAATRLFLKKGFKKIKIRKTVLVGNNLKNGCLPPVDRAGGVGPGTSRPSRGRDVPKNFCRPLLRAPSRIRKFLRCCSDPRANGKRANGKIFAPITSDVWTLIRSIKYSLIKKLIT
jgi:hypothetical protein